MKITLYYENKRHKTIIEVPDDEFTLMIENDYRQRLDTAEDKAAICRRTPQEILDDALNAPTYNRNRAATRPHKHIKEKYNDREPSVPFGFYPEYIDLYKAVEQLQPQQQELVMKVFWQGIKQVDIARDEGVAEAAISGRLARIYASLKKILKK